MIELYERASPPVTLHAIVLPFAMSHTDGFEFFLPELLYNGRVFFIYRHLTASGDNPVLRYTTFDHQTIEGDSANWACGFCQMSQSDHEELRKQLGASKVTFELAMSQSNYEKIREQLGCLVSLHSDIEVSC